MYAYGKRYHAREVILVYPRTDEIPAGPGTRTFRCDDREGDFEIGTYFVDVAKTGTACFHAENGTKSLVDIIADTSESNSQQL